MLPIRTILCPTDFSEHSIPAFDLACALARDYNANLIIAHVSPTPVPAVADGLVVDLPSGWEEEAKARLIEVRPSDPAIRYTHEFAIGDFGSEIVALAADKRADLIVMGTHGRGGLSRLLLGSVTDYVVRHAPCPVLSVRQSFLIPPGVPVKP